MNVKNIDSKYVVDVLQNSYKIYPTDRVTLINGGFDSAVFLIHANESKYIAKIYGNLISEVGFEICNNETRLYEYLLRNQQMYQKLKLI